jgi:hypothetical protein
MLYLNAFGKLRIGKRIVAYIVIYEMGVFLSHQKKKEVLNVSVFENARVEFGVWG